MRTKNTLNRDITLLHTGTVTELVQNGLGDALALYSFYCYTSSWQDTDSVRATDSFCRKGLGWGRKRFESAKKELVDRGIIKVVKRRNEAGKFAKNYIEVNAHLNRHLSKKRQVDKPTTNAWGEDKGNASDTVLNKFKTEETSDFSKSLLSDLQKSGVKISEKDDNRVNHEFQAKALEIIAALSVPRERKAAYFKAVKQSPRAHVLISFAFAVDHPTPQARDKMFFWKLNQLRRGRSGEQVKKGDAKNGLYDTH